MSNAGTLTGPEFNGLRRDVAAHLLDPSNSPECMDGANYGDQRGIRGPRSGRARRYFNAQNIVGVLPFFFPWDTGRIICTADGTWTVVSSPAAAGPAFAAFSGAFALCDSIACNAGVFTTTTKLETYVAGLLQSVV